ncbi:polyphenol oxidase family protein [Adlercreutzia sp. ZJ304]|uniref:polyphenol oxidase family protein n=1 Tax=Adlercreutzia sp. ZJ304 TaxID=2709791 RepID=UPI0013EB1911|nr:polyphenol oxidase family protein [Adlercreutzia sp. ZJ304]
MQPNYLQMPELRESASSGISFLTDDALFRACGVRIAFTGRAGGTSAPPFDTLNLGSHVGDDAAAVTRNRELALEALGAGHAHAVTLNQIHGCNVVRINSESELDSVRAKAAKGADAIVVSACNIAPILCFADCVSVIAVAPSGNFAVAHAGWRGVIAKTAVKAVRMLIDLEAHTTIKPDITQIASSINVYIGPHIGACCFQTGQDVREQFIQQYGKSVLSGADCVNLSYAIEFDLKSIGIDARRIVNCGICTVCNSQNYFSYRASGGKCGRHSAIAVRVC